MRPPATRPRLRKREVAFAIGAGALASFAAAGILSDGFGGPGSSFADRTEIASSEADNSSYEVGEFSEISTVGPQDIAITIGDSYAVRSEGSPEALRLLEVVVEDGKLVIKPKGRFGFNFDFDRLRGTKFFVTVPSLDAVALAGSGDITIDNLQGDDFVGTVAGSGSLQIAEMTVDEADFRIGGSGNVTVAGNARDAKVAIGGSGQLRGGGLRSDTASVSIGGSGDVALTVEEKADVSIAGSGNVDITGPARCSVSRFGSGVVRCSGAGGDTNADEN
jgi:hypothetical protein